MDFSQLNFVSSCQKVITGGGSTTTDNYLAGVLVSSDTVNASSSEETHCYNPAVSYLIIILTIGLFFTSMFIGYKLFAQKKLPL